MTKQPDPKKQVIARRIREARKLAGLSQGQVAKMLGLHRPSVSEAEAGNRSVTAEELAKLAEIYKVSVSWLAGEGAESADPHDDQVQLAARELQKLKPADLERLLAILATMRGQGGEK
jgi:transcriptional regulator with XRE-family HTH domain